MIVGSILYWLVRGRDLNKKNRNLSSIQNHFIAHFSKKKKVESNIKAKSTRQQKEIGVMDNN